MFGVGGLRFVLQLLVSGKPTGSGTDIGPPLGEFRNAVNDLTSEISRQISGQKGIQPIQPLPSVSFRIITESDVEEMEKAAAGVSQSGAPLSEAAESPSP